MSLPLGCDRIYYSIPVSPPAKVTQQPKPKYLSGKLQRDHKCRPGGALRDGLSQHWLRGEKSGLARP
ncbi:hypothetical protein [Moorena sp. SIO3B2]|uniref:hypothetical protein n=1 Tax=Moorena sp. SIO3B2 TaxID=2607827 RepID=UPI0013CD8343|nr:hypothetical protein [Moorena sp. SIO3B2]NEP32397.1 hypothetical protein [Moorena sp. SIO3B2]